MIKDYISRQVIQAIPLKQVMFQGIASIEPVELYSVVVMAADGDLTANFSEGSPIVLTGLLAGTAFALDQSVVSVTSTASILMS